MKEIKFKEGFIFNEIVITEDKVDVGGYLFPHSIPKSDVLEIKNNLENLITSQSS